MPLDPQDAGKLRDILEFGEKVMGMVFGISIDDLMSDQKTLFAICYGLQVIGEAGWKLSGPFKRTHVEIPWPLIAGMRHRLVHDYGRIDESVIHTAATVHVPRLMSQVREILDQDERGGLTSG